MLKTSWKRYLTVVLILIMVFAASGPLHAQERSGEAGSCLWKAVSERGTVYLLGSIHFLKKENYPLPPAMERAFDDAGAVVFEMDLDSAEDAAAQQSMLTKGLYPAGQRLGNRITQASYDLVKMKSAEMGFPIERMEQFKPWFISLTMLALKLRLLGFDSAYGIDRYFLTKAKQSRKEILSLETLDEQIDLFDGLSDEHQEMLLVQTMREFDTMDRDILQMVEAWRTGDAKVLEEFVMKSYRENPNVYDKLIFERNRRWLVQIETFLRQRKSALVVVGAAHLIGTEGLIESFRKKGYTVTQQ